MPLNITPVDLSERRPSWRDDTLKRSLLSSIFGGGVVFLPLACIGLMRGPFGPYQRVISDVFIGLAFWPIGPLSLLFPETPSEPPDIAAGPPELWLLVAPIISLVVYAVVAYIILSCLASRGRLK